jgi:hypothetical protein
MIVSEYEQTSRGIELPTAILQSSQYPSLQGPAYFINLESRFSRAFQNGVCEARGEVRNYDAIPRSLDRTAYQLSSTWALKVREELRYSSIVVITENPRGSLAEGSSNGR